MLVVSLAAQYRYLMAERHQAVPAAIEALGLDIAMTVFSLLALALAWRGLSARIERALVVVCALGSAWMNLAAANGGSPRSIAAFVMPPLLLAVVVDRVVAVVRRHVLGDTDRSAWTGFGRVALYALRFVLATRSTAKGLRRQVLVLTPLPDTSAAALPPAVTDAAALPAAVTPGGAAIPTTTPEPATQVNATRAAEPGDRPRRESKRAQLIDAYEALRGTDARYADRSKVSEVARELAPGASLAWGSARGYLYRHLDGKAASS